MNTLTVCHNSMPRALAGLVCCSALMASAPLHAAVVFFNNSAAFTSAMIVSGNTLLGIETFEESTLAPGTGVVFDDPLTQGVANGPFPAGLLQPMTVQSNLSGGAAVSPNPRGGMGLAAVSAGSSGAISDSVVANNFDDSLDWLFNSTTQITGVGFNPLSFFVPFALEVEVYDINNVLLGTATTFADNTGLNFLGIQATGGDLIGRINLFVQTDQSEGGDNIQLFQAVPEPTTLALLAIALAGLGFSRRKRWMIRSSIS